MCRVRHVSQGGRSDQLVVLCLRGPRSLPSCCFGACHSLAAGLRWMTSSGLALSQALTAHRPRTLSVTLCELACAAWWTTPRSWCPAPGPSVAAPACICTAQSSAHQWQLNSCQLSGCRGTRPNRHTGVVQAGPCGSSSRGPAPRRSGSERGCENRCPAPPRPTPPSPPL